MKKGFDRTTIVAGIAILAGVLLCNLAWFAGVIAVGAKIVKTVFGW